MTLHQEYAYVRNQCPDGRARTHLVTDADIVGGRLRRAPGDALCKPREKFYVLNHQCAQVELDDLCPKCVDIARRLSLRIPTPSIDAALRATTAMARQIVPTIIHRITSVQWPGVFSEASRDGPIGLFEKTTSYGSAMEFFYNGPALVILEELDEIWNGLSPACRDAIAGRDCPGDGLVRHVLTRRRLIRHDREEDWKLPLGEAVVRRAEDRNRTSRFPAHVSDP